MKFLDKIIKGVNPDDEEPFNDDVFEDDEIYGASNNNMGNDLGDYIPSGGYSPYTNQNQGGMGMNQNQIQNQNYNQNQNQNQMQQGYQQHQTQSPVPVHSGITIAGGGNMQLSVELKVVKPEDYNNVTEIADHLLNGKTVILNLEETNKETARRLIDFLNGVAYAIKGQVERVADRTFVITPSNVPIDNAQLKEDIRRNTRNDNSIY